MCFPESVSILNTSSGKPLRQASSIARRGRASGLSRITPPLAAIPSRSLGGCRSPYQRCLVHILTREKTPCLQLGSTCCRWGRDGALFRECYPLESESFLTALRHCNDLQIAFGRKRCGLPCGVTAVARRIASAYSVSSPLLLSLVANLGQLTFGPVDFDGQRERTSKAPC